MGIAGIDLIREFKIRQADKTEGLRNREGFLNEFDASGKSKFDIAFPHDVDLLLGDYWVPATTDPKTRLWVEIAPNTDLALLAPGAALLDGVSVSDTEISVDPMAAAALNGFLAANGSVQTDRVHFRVTSVPADPMDWTKLKMGKWVPAESKIKLYGSDTMGVEANAGDKIYVTIRWEDGSYLAPGQYVRIGDETEGSSNLPLGIPIRIIIDNPDTNTLELGFNLAYLHD